MGPSACAGSRALMPARFEHAMTRGGEQHPVRSAARGAAARRGARTVQIGICRHAKQVYMSVRRPRSTGKPPRSGEALPAPRGLFPSEFRFKHDTEKHDMHGGLPSPPAPCRTDSSTRDGSRPQDGRAILHACHLDSYLKELRPRAHPSYSAARGAITRDARGDNPFGYDPAHHLSVSPGSLTSRRRRGSWQRTATRRSSIYKYQFYSSTDFIAKFSCKLATVRSMTI